MLPQRANKSFFPPFQKNYIFPESKLKHLSLASVAKVFGISFLYASSSVIFCRLSGESCTEKKIRLSNCDLAKNKKAKKHCEEEIQLEKKIGKNCFCVEAVVTISESKNKIKTRQGLPCGIE